MDGVVVVDKPQGPTSHDVVARLRRALRTREVGHAGTLDPMATGVLVVAVGEATKLVPWLTAHDKEYLADVRFGVETDTLDADGAPVRETPIPPEIAAEIRAGRGPRLDAALDAERARARQAPPAFSAIKKGGRPAHELARRGEVVELEERDVAVRAIDVVGGAEATLSVRVATAKGYYVRSLARDLGAALGLGAHLVALRRIRSGPFGIDEACPLDAPDLAARIVPMAAAAARALPALVLAPDAVPHARAGRRVPLPDDAPEGPAAWLDADGALVAIGARVAGEAHDKVIRGFVARPGP